MSMNLPRRIEIVENATGKILFTMIPSTESAVYLLDDMTGLIKSVSIYDVPLTSQEYRTVAIERR